MIADFRTWEEAFVFGCGHGVEIPGELYRIHQDEIDRIAAAHGFTRFDDILADEVLFTQVH